MALEENIEIQDTFKFRTVLFIILGLIVPLWFISLPLFWWLAWKSYKAGVPAAPIKVDVQSAGTLNLPQSSEKLCMSCHKTIPANSIACPYCGEGSKTLACSFCNAECGPEYKYCPDCGKLLPFAITADEIN